MPVEVYDVNSLYPHIIISHNISSDTVIGWISGNDDDLRNYLRIPDHYYELYVPDRSAGRLFALLFVFDMHDYIEHRLFTFETPTTKYQLKGSDLIDMIKSNNYIVTMNGVLFDSKKIGILPQIEMELLEKRAYYKQQGDNIKQQAYKILANSLYGVFGTASFFGYNVYIAEAITITGQFTVNALSMLVNQYLQGVENPKISLDLFCDAFNDYDGQTRFLLYRDTDSLFIYNKTDKNIKEFIDVYGRILYDNTTLKFADNKDHFLKYSPKVKQEFVGDAAIFTGAKKRYFIYDSKSDKYKLAGFLAKSQSELLRDLIVKTLINIAEGKLTKYNKMAYFNKLREKISSYVSDFENIESMVLTVAWNSDKYNDFRTFIDISNKYQDVKQFENIIKNIPPNIFAMIIYNTIVDEPVFTIGSKAHSLPARWNMMKIHKILTDKLKDPRKVMLLTKKISNSNIVAFEDYSKIIDYIDHISVQKLLFDKIIKYLEENILDVLN